MLALLLGGLWLTACESDRIDIPEENTSGFRFMLSLPDEMTVETKADGEGDAGSVSLGSSDPVEIKDAWILQYKTDNTLFYEYLSSGFTKKTGVVELTTKKTFLQENSRFYIIINGGEGLFPDTYYTGEGANKVLSITEDNLKAITVSMLDASSKPQMTSYPDLLTAGPINYTPPATTETGSKVVFVSSLTRPYAKFSLQVDLVPPTSSSTTPSFDISDVIVSNVPKSMALYAKGGAASGNYPDQSSIYVDLTSSSPDISLSSITVPTTSPLSFYMAENHRGIGSATSAKDKNIASNGPGGSLVGCTSLTLKGTYRYDGTKKADDTYVQDGITVEYKFYLGDNMINDYNIQRNYHYNISIKIAGPNSADYRVKITNGNVAVFDDVTTITNTVTF